MSAYVKYKYISIYDVYKKIFIKTIVSHLIEIKMSYSEIQNYNDE